jgi:hypothetical protein
MNDEEIGTWCDWFEAHLEDRGRSWRESPDDWLWAYQVDFAESQLTGAGADRLMDTLLEKRVAVQVLKLHHNRIDAASGLANYLEGSEGCLRELHLSHNELDSEACAAIVAAVGAAEYKQGKWADTPCYPRSTGARTSVPLWLRLEQNRVDPASFQELVSVRCAKLGRPGANICVASSKGCTPHSCNWRGSSTPMVHTKNLSCQRPQLGDDDRPATASADRLAADVSSSDKGSSEVATDTRDSSALEETTSTSVLPPWRRRAAASPSEQATPARGTEAAEEDEKASAEAASDPAEDSFRASSEEAD